MRHPTHQDRPIAVVDRIAAIVNCVAENGNAPVSIGEVSRQTHIPKSTVSRIVQSVIPHGLLEHHRDGLVLGLRFFELGEQAARPRTLRRMTFEHMERLRRTTGQTIHLAVLDGPHVVYIEILRASTAPSLASRVGGRVPAYATAIGKALLAFSPPEVAERVIAAGLEPLTPDTITDPDRLRADLWRARAQGYALEVKESGPDSACVGGPILTGIHNHPVAGLSVSGRAGDIDLEKCAVKLQETLKALRRQVDRLPAGSRTI